jgi:anti-anti-sigma regulatory factor
LPTWTRFPIWAQVTLLTTSIGAVIAILGGGLTYSFVLRSVQEVVASEVVPAIGFFVLGTLVFAVFVGVLSGVNLSREVRGVTKRLDSLADQDMTLQHGTISQTSLDEVGDLVQAFNHVRLRTDEYTALLRDSVSDLEAANEQRQRLLETLAGSTASVIPVAKGVAIVPLSGYFDGERASHIRSNLLAGIVRERARIVVIDLTGIVEVTEVLVEQLTLAARSAALMGCEVVLTGIGADLAWTLVQADSDLEALTTYRDLEDGLAFAYARMAR